MRTLRDHPGFAAVARFPTPSNDVSFTVFVPTA
jgi:hypothetical protein